MGAESFKDETVVASIHQLEGMHEKEPAIDFLGGPSMGQQIILHEGEIVFGRSKDAGIVVEDEAISRHHFKINVRNKVAVIEDLKSTNGTYVNNKRIREQVLKANDKIQISSATVMRFSYVDSIDKNSHERFYEMALYDPVTTAHTKRYFLDRIQHEFAHSSRRNLPLSLILFDLDFFKKVNDTYGHPAGDFILQKIAEVTKSMTRREDILARYGGEEFAVLMRDTEEADAVRWAERLRKKIAESGFLFESHRIPVTVSIGVACLKDANFLNFQDLIRSADQYLYSSKSKGRNRVSATSMPV
ncbi:MAG TPA: GGDEF domain-containing protein [Deltaproteobacteria bacterium]|nr:GGDEF domain-containing protein [Deltaproteobacteria bacterium]